MRVIAGAARGRRLQAPSGMAVRPTSDRLRGAVFSMLGDAVVGTSFLDACAGSGAIGIEALSRGAERAFFAEPAAAALAVIDANLDHCGLPGGQILRMTWQSALGRLESRGVALDFAYFDPPYESTIADEFLNAIQPLLRPQGLALIEHRRTTAVLTPPGFELHRRLRAGDSRVSVFGRTEPTASFDRRESC